MRTLTINGVDMAGYWWDDRQWRVAKNGTAEDFTAILCDIEGLFRPEKGHRAVLMDDTVLLFGGPIQAVQDVLVFDERENTEVLVTQITAIDERVLAAECDIDQDIPAGDALEIVDELVSARLGPKGVTNVGATSGGATADALTVEHQPLSAVLDHYAALLQRHWLITGALQFAMVQPGDIVYPTALTPANSWGLRRKATRAEYASVLIVRTGGSGVITHTETHLGTGTQTTFLLNVQPQILRQETSPGSITKTVLAPTEVDEDGTPYTIGDGRWSYDADLHALVKVDGGPLGDLVPVSVTYAVELPAWVRVWNPAVALNSDGTWNYAGRVDRQVQSALQDLPAAIAWARAELAKRGELPDEYELSTYLPDLYPFTSVALDYPDEAEGAFLIDRVVITPDPDGRPRYDLTVLDGIAGRRWQDYYRQRQGVAGGTLSVISGAGSAGSPGSGGLPAGLSLSLGGSNVQTITLTTSWQDIAEAIPVYHPADPAGVRRIRTYAYQLAAGTMELRLLVGGSDVGATLSTTAVGSYVDNSFFDALEDTYAGPALTGPCLLQARATSGSRQAVVGHSTTTKEL